MDYLKSIGVEKTGKTIKRSPTILLFKIESLAERVDYLKSIGVERIGKAVERNPAILIYGVDALAERVNYLKSIGVERIGKAIEKIPTILIYGVNALIERVDYFKSIGAERIGKTVEKYPDLLTLSIKKNLEPSYKFYLQKLELSEKEIIDHLMFFRYSLKRLQDCVSYLESKSFDVSNLDFRTKSKLIISIKLKDLQNNIKILQNKKRR